MKRLISGSLLCVMVFIQYVWWPFFHMHSRKCSYTKSCVMLEQIANDNQRFMFMLLSAPCVSLIDYHLPQPPSHLQSYFLSCRCRMYMLVGNFAFIVVHMSAHFFPLTKVTRGETTGGLNIAASSRCWLLDDYLFEF